VTEHLPATSDEVAALLGELDPFIMERILAVGASVDEIDEARRATEDELAFGEEPHVPSSPRVAEVRAILDEVVVDDVTQGDEEREHL
jgi:hypothetical protein